MLNIPRTMTKEGLLFLKELSSLKSSGVYLEIGPLFGSSTSFIDLGRKQAGIKDDIHTIDTFEAAPWVREKFNFDLSKDLFTKFTKHIPNLIIHQGFSPDIVSDTWEKTIGFYFDDATHGDPGWSNNYKFFSKFLADDAIICGDDFAGGWPDIVKNVYSLASDFGSDLYVIGRVWVLTRRNQSRIENAIDRLYPSLSSSHIAVSRSGEVFENKAATWSYGLHTATPLEWIEFKSDEINYDFVILKGGRANVYSNKIVDLQDIDSILLQCNKNLSIQYCICNMNGKTSNTKSIPSGRIFDIPEGYKIVSVRLTHS